MAAPSPRVFTIPASVPFLPTLIGALANGRLVSGFAAGADPLALARVTLYLPTRRACRLARDEFLGVLGGDAAILPRIVAIGDVDADEIAFAEAATVSPAGAALDLPETLDGLARKTLLAELILKWAASPAMHGLAGASLVASTPASALGLAGELARLMDDMITRQVPWDRLDGLVPEDVDEYWQHTLRFLKLAHEQWPPILAEHNAIEPAERRDRLIEAERARLKQLGGPVIAAGSTGSMPATAALLETIAGLPQGAVVLPGLDTDLDDPAWDSIGSDEGAPSHPQFAMQALLRRIGIAREAVTALAPPAPHGRERLASEALRPAGATELWRERLHEAGFAERADAAFAGISVIEAANAEEEALAIAVALREALETPRKSAALATPDRALARRVHAALARWQVPVEDSRGDDLGETPAGVFARLVAEAGLGGLEPVTLLAMLKHPLCTAAPRAVAVLERALLRGPRPRSRTAGLDHALKTFRGIRDNLHPSDPRRAISNAELEAAQALVARLAAALEPLESITSALPFAEIAARHRVAIGRLGSESEELGGAFDEIAAAGRLAVAPADYAELFRAALADRIVRAPEAGARVHIFGLLEARLQSVDRLVLGGLTEGTWPPETRSDPWLSRPMRQALGLDLPERRIGLSAHDFAQALGVKEVVLSHAAKVAGAPTVPSRFMQRLKAVTGETRWQHAVTRGDKYLGWARALDRPVRQARPVSRPEPKPPLAARPMSLSVTEIELWLRDPYSIYARHVLRLRPLDPVNTPPGARDRGTVVHGAIGDFTLKFKDRLPADPSRELLMLGEQHFSKLDDFPDAKAFWWPRFQRIAQWFVEFEKTRRESLIKLDAEQSAKFEIALPEGVFTLRARADRIEHRADGSYAILDYKTGRVPSAQQVRTGFAPQLTLEGAILRAGGFGDIPAGGSIAEFMYVALRGGQQPGEPKVIAWKDSSPNDESDIALAKLTRLVTQFANLDTGYRSLERPMFLRRNAGDYDHLSRVKEWSLSAGAADPEESE